MKLHMRDGTMDMSIAKEVRGYMDIFKNYKGGTIMDCGANIGAFSLLCASRYPESKIIAYEPEKDNFELMVKNLKLNNANNVVPIEAGVGPENGHVKLYINTGKNKGLHSTRQIRGRTETQLINIASFSEALAFHQPEILKIDIEDAEFEIEEEICHLPSCVKALAIEIHLRPQRFRDVNAPYMLKALHRQFPNIIKGHKLAMTAWTMVFQGLR